MKKVAIITTSIGDKKTFQNFFNAYSKVDTKSYNSKLFVIGDLNSPKIDFNILPEFQRFIKQGFDFEYVSAESQESLMDSKSYLEDLIPWKRIQRRNIGYFLAHKQNFNYIIAVDDDNLPLSTDFISSHINNLEGEISQEVVEVISNDQWFNPCSFLESHIVHRGFPLNKRYSSPQITKRQREADEKIIVSAGFWEGDPDIDALTRLEGNPKNTYIESLSKVTNFCIGKNVRAPFNSQNTSFGVDVVPAIFLSSKNGRYDDIWASYFLKSILQVNRGLVSYGNPIVRQERNDHDLIRDLENELYGMRNTEAFVDELFSFTKSNKKELQGLNYLEATKLISNQLLIKSKDFAWYYLDLLRWCDLLETDYNL
jgi:hypothetical protein